MSIKMFIITFIINIKQTILKHTANFTNALPQRPGF